MITCPACSTQNGDDAKFCKSCGAQISSQPVQPASDSQAASDAYAPTVPVVQQPVQTNVQRPLKDRSIALILEIIPGLFGLLGIGWMYSGNTTTGVIWLIGFLIWTAMATVVSILTAGFGIICWLPISIILIAVSATSLNNYTKKHPEIFGV
jgi:hypothetical protein